MPVVIALVSQKGGVGKSTIARALGALLARAGAQVKIADLDHRQTTCERWSNERARVGVKPPLDVSTHSSPRQAIESARNVQVVIIDTPAGTTSATLEVAQHAHLIVQPTGAGVDDLHPGVLLFHALVAAGIAKDRLVFALSRIDPSEEADARTYIAEAGYAVLPGALVERVEYRRAQNHGRAAIETEKRELNAIADALMLALMSHVAADLKAATLKKPTRTTSGGGQPERRRTSGH